MKKLTYLVLAMLNALGWSAQAHEHIAAGIDGQGDLALVSGMISGAVYHMLPETKTRYTGYLALDEQIRDEFPNDYFTFIALSDGQTEDPQPNHAPTGTDVWMEITSVSGPTGATFGYWEADWSYEHNTPTQSFLTNAPTGGFKFELSEPLYFIDPEDQDPYGHIHDRGWTVDQPGDYYVGFTLYDLSEVGPGGGPLEQPSQTYTFHFQAIPEPGGSSLLAWGGAALCASARRRQRDGRASRDSV